MPDPPNQPRRLVSYYGEYAPTRFKRRNGRPLKLRAQQDIAKRLGLPLIFAGGEPLVDPEEADEVVRTSESCRRSSHQS